MADRIDNLTERVQVVEGKVDRLTVTVGQLTSTVGQLTSTVGQLTSTVGQLTSTVGQLAETMERRFEAVDQAFLEQREYTEFCTMRVEAKMDAGFVKVDASIARMERKLDQFIDVQSKTNELVDRRLRALER